MPRYYAIRQAHGRVIGSRPMTEREADYEVRVWAANIGPARAVPVTPVMAAAVRTYDQAVLVPALNGAGPGLTAKPMTRRDGTPGALGRKHAR